MWTTRPSPSCSGALRGGGGNFGVVTSMTLRAYPQGLATSGSVLYPASEGAAILRGVRDFMLDAQDHVSIAFAYLYGPDDPSVPESLRGQLMAASWPLALRRPGPGRGGAEHG